MKSEVENQVQDVVYTEVTQWAFKRGPISRESMNHEEIVRSLFSHMDSQKAFCWALILSSGYPLRAADILRLIGMDNFYRLIEQDLSEPMKSVESDLRGAFITWQLPSYMLNEKRNITTDFLVSEAKQKFIEWAEIAAKISFPVKESLKEHPSYHGNFMKSDVEKTLNSFASSACEVGFSVIKSSPFLEKVEWVKDKIKVRNSRNGIRRAPLEKMLGESKEENENVFIAALFDMLIEDPENAEKLVHLGITLETKFLNKWNSLNQIEKEKIGLNMSLFKRESRLYGFISFLLKLDSSYVIPNESWVNMWTLISKGGHSVNKHIFLEKQQGALEGKAGQMAQKALGLLSEPNVAKYECLKLEETAHVGKNTTSRKRL